MTQVYMYYVGISTNVMHLSVARRLLKGPSKTSAIQDPSLPKTSVAPDLDGPLSLPLRCHPLFLPGYALLPPAPQYGPLPWPGEASPKGKTWLPAGSLWIIVYGAPPTESLSPSPGPWRPGQKLSPTLPPWSRRF